MKIRLKKAHTPHFKKLKKGTEMQVTNDYGAELVKEGVAEEITGYLQSEVETIDAAIDELENTEIKKVAKTKTSKK